MLSLSVLLLCGKYALDVRTYSAITQPAQGKPSVHVSRENIQKTGEKRRCVASASFKDVARTQ